MVIIGRVNPSETYSSYVIHGALNYLLSQDALVHKLRDHFEVWVLPILNPDGVALGNNTGNIQGKDLG